MSSHPWTATTMQCLCLLQFTGKTKTTPNPKNSHHTLRDDLKGNACSPYNTVGFWESSEILTAAQSHGACTCGITKSQFLQSHADPSTVQHGDLISRYHTAKPRAKQLKSKGSAKKNHPSGASQEGWWLFWKCTEIMTMTIFCWVTAKRTRRKHVVKKKKKSSLAASVTDLFPEIYYNLWP